MEIVLLAITLVSLVAAFVMSAAAWRMSREERTRSAARVAALAAAASEATTSASAPSDEPLRSRHAAGPDAAAPPIVAPAPRPAAPAPAVAPWAPARVSRAHADVPVHQADLLPRAPDLPLRGRQAAPLGEVFLGSAVAKPASGGQRGLAVAAAILFVVTVAGGYFTIFGGGGRPMSAAASPGADSPLELVSLRHERNGGRLAITGLVRNPVAGVAVEKLAAVALLFDQHGALVTSSRADVDFTRLTPGDESPFVISVDAPAGVARYRVSFRNEAGVVPHIDRRGQEPIARDTP